MNPLFKAYNTKYEDLKDLLQDDVPRSLRLFNIRFRLALDIELGFKGEVSLTKTKSVRETYIEIIKLMEMWNAYEALYHYVKSLDRHVNPKASKAKIYSQKFLSEVGSLEILKEGMDTLKTEYQTNTRFKKDFDQYIDRIVEDPRIKGTLTEDAKNILKYFRDKQGISGIELLSLVYAERNMYFHNGETAKMGMSYTNRKRVIRLYREYFTIHILKVINFILDEVFVENE
jgi:hypothetical protein